MKNILIDHGRWGDGEGVGAVEGVVHTEQLLCYALSIFFSSPLHIPFSAGLHLSVLVLFSPSPFYSC